MIFTFIIESQTVRALTLGIIGRNKKVSYERAPARDGCQYMEREISRKTATVDLSAWKLLIRRRNEVCSGVCTLARSDNDIRIQTRARACMHVRTPASAWWVAVADVNDASTLVHPRVPMYGQTSRCIVVPTGSAALRSRRDRYAATHYDSNRKRIRYSPRENSPRLIERLWSPARDNCSGQVDQEDISRESRIAPRRAECRRIRIRTLEICLAKFYASNCHDRGLPRERSSEFFRKWNKSAILGVSGTLRNVTFCSSTYYAFLCSIFDWEIDGNIIKSISS